MADYDPLVLLDKLGTACLAEEESQVELRVDLAKAVVRAGAEYQIVLGSLDLCVSRVVSLWVEVVGILVHVRVVKSHVCRGDQHGAFGNRVRVGDGKRLLHKVRNHQHRGAVAEQLANDGARVLEGLELVHVELGVNVTVADPEVLLSNAIQDVGSLSGNLEEPCSGAAGSILGGKEKGEDGLGNLVVAEHAQQGVRLLHALAGALALGFAPALRVDHLQNPAVHDAGDVAARSHAHLALGGALGELGQDHVGGLLPVPRLRQGNDDGEVDKLEGGRDEVVVVGNSLDGLVRDVVADKGTARDGTHELAEFGHEGDGLAVVARRNLDKLLKVSLVHRLLAGQVRLEGLAGKETVEALAEVDV